MCLLWDSIVHQMQILDIYHYNLIIILALIFIDIFFLYLVSWYIVLTMRFRTPPDTNTWHLSLKPDNYSCTNLCRCQRYIFFMWLVDILCPLWDSILNQMQIIHITKIWWSFLHQNLKWFLQLWGKLIYCVHGEILHLTKC